MTPIRDTFEERIHAIDQGIAEVMASLRSRPMFERRLPEKAKPRITCQEAYEAAAVYLRQSGEVYTAALVEEALHRVDRRNRIEDEDDDMPFDLDYASKPEPERCVHCSLTREEAEGEPCIEYFNPGVVPTSASIADEHENHLFKGAVE